jgi:hemoglobin-like flavoprotein
MEELTLKERFIQSLDRCSGNDEFIPSFYNRFLSTSEEIRYKFLHTNFEKQNQMLLRSLRMAADATSGVPESLREMRERAETHNRHHLNIKPHLYELWLAAVVETASEFDNEWNEANEEAWNSVLGHAIKHMTKYY